MPDIKLSSVINFFFPKFSEIELVSLFYLILLFTIHRWELLFSFTIESWELVSMGIIAASISLLVFFNAVSYRKASQIEKKIFSFCFYLLLSMITIYSLASSSSRLTNSFGNPVLEMLELLIIFFLFLKSFARLILMRYASKHIIEDLGNQMQDKQLNVIELITIILFAPVFYILLQANNSLAQVVCLSYFYLNIVIRVTSKMTERYLTVK